MLLAVEFVLIITIMNIIRIGSHNIQGSFKNKFSEDEFLDILSRFHIFGVLETRLTDSHSIQVNGYQSFRSNRCKGKYKYNTRGIAVLYKNELQKGITKCDTKK